MTVARPRQRLHASLPADGCQATDRIDASGIEKDG
jgi:hypothetical protein